MNEINPLVVLCSLVPILYISVFVHEAGHALLGRAAGFFVTSFGVGLGRPWVVIPCGRTRMFLCRSHPFQGITFCFPSRVFPPRTKTVLLLAGGIIANGLFMVIAFLFCLWMPWGSSIWITAAGVNGLFATLSLVPFQWHVGKTPLRSDGRLILQAVQNRAFLVPEPVLIQMFKSLRGLWQSIGDHPILRVNLLGAAQAWAELEDFELAESLCADLESVPKCDLPAYLARDALIQSAIACGRGRLDDASNLLDTAVVHFRSIGDLGGLVCARIQHASLRIHGRDVGGAVAEIDDLRSHELVSRNPEIQIALLELRLLAQAALSETDAVAEILVQYEAIRRRRPSASRDLRVYKMLARLHAQKGDWARAELGFRKAVAAMRNISDLWVDESDQSRFLENQASFLNEGRVCFQMLNTSESFDVLVKPLLFAAQIRQQNADAASERDRRRHRLGMRIMLANLVFIVSLLVVGFLVDRRTSATIFAVDLGFVCLTSYAGIYLIVRAAIARFYPHLRKNGGGVLLLLACAPWLYLLGLAIFLVFIPRQPA